MTDDQQQPNEFPAPKPLPGSVYIRPGIDDRPDYDKVLSPEDKSAAAAGDPSEVICATWVSACVTDASTLRRG